MKKISNVFGLISLIVALISFIIILSFMFQEASGDWASLGFMLFGIIFVIITIILTIPFMIVLFTIKFQQMKFHFFSHLALIVMSITMLIIGLNT
ncbi:MAG: hypothetical protein WC992_05045 [Acholeplasmataceae bacterium]|jgi:hypothetical protein